MNDPSYEAWKRERSTAAVPAGFADRVMDRVRRTRRPAKPRWAETDPATWLFSRRYLAAAVFVLAAGAGLMRLVSVMAMILLTPAGGY
jgi:hypothetical protein